MGRALLLPPLMHLLWEFVGMVGYLIRRILVALPVVWVVSLIVFAIMHVIPGDPATLALRGEGGVSPEQIEALREQLGLNDPLYVQYGRFVWNGLHGNLGRSTRLKSSVTSVIKQAFPFTVQLSVAALLVSIGIGLPLGILAALKRGSWVDSVCMAISLSAVSMPVFYFGLLMIFLFSFTLSWFPPVSRTMEIRYLVLPAVSLGFINAGLVARLVRSNLLEVLHRDYVNTARSKGLAEWVVVLRHVLRNALIPTVTVVGLQLARMLTGAAVTETVFGRAGLGRLVVNAVIWKDYPLVQGTVMFAAVLFLLMNLLVDITYSLLDPRIHYD